jgi:predicted transcriptional regulator
MKKEARVEFGITITKPWSKEMYDHNEEVAEIVKEMVHQMWVDALKEAIEDYRDEDELGNLYCEMDWGQASDEMERIQKAITYYSYSNQSIEEVADEVEETLEDMPLYQLKELVEELEIKLDKGFIGFN